MPDRLAYVSVMRIGLLKRSLVALLMLAMASAWQITPSFAAPPCQINAGATTDAHPPTSGGHCKSVSGDCVAIVCCQILPSLLAPQGASVTALDWGRVLYPGVAPMLAGLRLEPNLHPPTTLA